MIDSSKIGFFYQSSSNPAAVFMNLKQIKTHYPESKVSFWEDITDMCKDLCDLHGIKRRKVNRLTEVGQWNRSAPATNVVSAVHYLNRIYLSLMRELKGVKWFLHMEDDVWLNGPLLEEPDFVWGGGLQRTLHPFSTTSLGIKEDTLTAACGGVLIEREAFLDAYLKVQDIDWNGLEQNGASEVTYTDGAISTLLAFSKIAWTSWSKWRHFETDFVKYEEPIIHNVKYWYSHPLTDLQEVNTRPEVKNFLENHGYEK